MTTRFLLLVSAVFICFGFKANAALVEVHVTHAVFHRPSSNESYVESYFSINPQTLSYKKQSDSSYQASLIITMLFKNEKNEIIHFDKFELKSPKYKTISAIAADEQAFLSERRNALAKGNYTIDIEVVNDKLTTSASEKLKIELNETKYSFSNIELLDTFYENKTISAFSRGNVDLIPSVINYFPSFKNQMHFYTELYSPKGAEIKGKILLQYAIVKKENGKVMDEFSNSFAVEMANLTPILNSVDISKLQSGNYEFQIQALSRGNEILAKASINFQRSKLNRNLNWQLNDTLAMVSKTDVQNTFVNQFTMDEIQKRLTTLYPVANAAETGYIDNLLKDKKENNMKMFYYNFWVNRNPENPIAAYTEYETQLMLVNNAFGLSFKYGFETSRGRVYLQYGAPNSINKSTQSSDMLPYEIWEYYAIGNQKNVKFVFYAKDRSTNDYELAYSNKRGEVGDPDWLSKIQNLPANTDLDNNTYNKNVGNTFDRDFNQSIIK
ncbi:MAG: hypothetical protein RJA07_1909 [Bacteroidota bacterium]|jgi:GWxTD domain-containing protein